MSARHTTSVAFSVNVGRRSSSSRTLVSLTGHVAGNSMPRWRSSQNGGLESGKSGARSVGPRTRDRRQGDCDLPSDESCTLGLLPDVAETCGSRSSHKFVNFAKFYAAICAEGRSPARIDRDVRSVSTRVSSEDLASNGRRNSAWIIVVAGPKTRGPPWSGTRSRG